MDIENLKEEAYDDSSYRRRKQYMTSLEKDEHRKMQQYIAHEEAKKKSNWFALVKIPFKEKDAFKMAAKENGLKIVWVKDQKAWAFPMGKLRLSSPVILPSKYKEEAEKKIENIYGGGYDLLSVKSSLDIKWR